MINQANTIYLKIGTTLKHKQPLETLIIVNSWKLAKE